MDVISNENVSGEQAKDRVLVTNQKVHILATFLAVSKHTKLCLPFEVDDSAIDHIILCLIVHSAKQWKEWVLASHC